jgi:hypothetical protein
MKNKATKKQQPPQKTPGKKGKRPWAILVVVIISATIGVIYWKNNQTTNKSTSTPPTQVKPKADENQLVGRWVRTDSGGNYIIEIKSVAADGKLDASYLNPYPIKVGRTEWQNKNGNLTIVVELRDVNYPGSTYTLNFSPDGKRLTGNYYQAVEGANFDVEFVRI